MGQEGPAGRTTTGAADASDGSAPTRVAVVGGGMSALALAWWLSGMEGRYQVTVYQLGWRLGGKLASARNMAYDGRIEEHGLHVWSGFYENAFSMLRSVYAELDRSPGQPLATWTEAFSPWSDVSWMSRLGDSWVRATNLVPTNDALPGDGGRLASPAGLLARMLEFGVRLLQGYLPPRPDPAGTGATDAAPPACDPADVVPHVRGFPEPPAPHADPSELLTWLFRGAQSLLESWEQERPGDDVCDQLTRAAEKVAGLLHELLDSWLDHVIEHDPEVLEVLALVDLALAYLRGFLRDGVFDHGFGVIDGEDLTHWLCGAGAHELTLQSGFVRGAYSYVFAFRNGDPTQPELEAGTALRMLLRLLLAASGAVFWRMNAGAGDAVVAPVYQVLARRGVEFRFFHALRSVELDADGAVASATFGLQATVSAGPAAYDPLFDLDGLCVWPSHPCYEQLEEGAELRARQVDLESAWTDWPDRGLPIVRERGRDFDVLVLGLPPSCLPIVAPAVVAASSVLRAAVAAIPTVATQSLQLWCTPSTSRLGGPQPATILTAFAPPLDTWADMSHLVAAEHWPPGVVQSIQYFCGPLAIGDGPAPGPDPAYPDAVHEDVGINARAWLEANASVLWTAAGGGSQGGGSQGGAFDWTVLYPFGWTSDPFSRQYWSANIDPSARYCQSPVGSAASRPDPGGTGIPGLVVVGDWVRTGLGYGCIEAAVMGGLAGARAISGSPVSIYGETDFPPFEGPSR